MSYKEESRAIRMAVSSRFSEVPVRYEEAIWENPSSGEWLELTIVSGNGQNISIGNINTGTLRTRYLGFVQADIYTEKRTGLTRAHEIADLFVEALENRYFEPCRMREASSVRLPSDKPGYARFVVRIGFQRDKTA